MKMTHKDNTIKALLEPSHSILPLHTVLEPYPSPLRLPLRNTPTRASHDNVEVHPENTNVRVVPRAQVDMFGDTETEVTSLAEVLAAEFVFLHLQPALEDFFGLGPADGDVHGDLLVSPDTEGTHGESCF